MIRRVEWQVTARLVSALLSASLACTELTVGELRTGDTAGSREGMETVMSSTSSTLIKALTLTVEQSEGKRHI